MPGPSKRLFMSGPGGAPGPANVLTIRSILTGPAGSAASATVSGTAPNQVIDLIIPRGDVGAAGPAAYAPIVPWAQGLLCVASAPATTVSVNGGSYVCAVSNIASASFATDLAAGYWLPLAPAGAAGNGIQNGSGAPANSLGANGDFYLDTANTRLYGPKAGGAWPTGYTGLVGAGALLAANNLSDVSSPIAAQASLGLMTQPQGRLTLTSGTPVMTSAVSAASTVYYTPLGRLALVGTGLSTPPVPAFFSEVSQALSDATKSPSAAAAGQVYDYFAWNDGGTFRVTRGPAWSAGAGAGSNTARGTGAGSTALTRVFGALVNAFSITNGPAAGMGVYVGTIATDLSGATVSWSLGGSASNGSQAAILNVWNAFERRLFRPFVQDTTASWSYAGGNGLRSINGSNSNRITFVVGVTEDAVEATYKTNCNPASTLTAVTSLGLDSTTAAAPSAINGTGANSSSSVQFTDVVASWSGNLLGAHFLQAIENVSSGGSTTFYGAPYGGLRGSVRA